MEKTIRLISSVIIPALLFVLFTVSYKQYLPQRNVIELLDNYILQGIDELKQDNPVYEERKDDFLLMDNIETILEYLSQINESLEPKSQSFVIEEFDLISAILKELITIPSVDLMLLSK